MSDTLRDLVVSLSLQTDNFTRNIRSVNKQIQEAESLFKLAAAGVDNFEQTAQGLSTRLSTLQQKLTLQKEVVSQYQRALDAARTKLTECYTRQGEYAQRLAKAKQEQLLYNATLERAISAYNDCKARLGETDEATKAASARLAEIRKNYLETAEEVKKLSGQCEALKKSTLNAADAVSQGNINLNKASAAVKQTEAAIQSTNQELALAQTQWKAAGDAIKASEAAIASIGNHMKGAEASFRLATVGIKDMDTSAEGLSARMTLLRSNLQSQNQAVREYENILQSAGEQLEAAMQANDPEKIREATEAITTAETALKNAQTAVKKTEADITDCNAALRLANTNWASAGEQLRQSQQAFAAIGRDIQLAEAEFRLATAGIKDINQSAEGLSAKLDMLKQKWSLQRDAVVQCKDALQAANDQFLAAVRANDPEKIRQATDAITSAEIALKNAQAAVKKTEADITDCNDALRLANAGWASAGERLQQSQQAIAAVGRDIQLAEAKFRQATVGIKDLEQSAEGLSAKLLMLNQKWALHRVEVSRCETALQAAKDQFLAAGRASDPEKIRQATAAVTAAETALRNAKTAVKQTEMDIADCNAALQLANTNWASAGERLQQSQQAFASIGREIRIAEAEFKLATVGIQDIEQSTEGLSAKLDMLSQKWMLQREAVVQCENALQAAREQLAAAQQVNDPEKIRQATEAVDNAQVSLTNAQIALSQTEQEIHATGDALSLAETNWYAAGQAIAASKNAIAGIGQQMQSAEASFRLATVGMKDMDTSVEGLSARMTLLQSRLQGQNQAVLEYESILRSAQAQLTAAQEANDPEKIREATEAVTSAETALKNAQAAVKQTEADIADCNTALRLANAGWASAGERLQQSQQAFAAIGREIQLAEAEFRLATVGIEALEQSTEGLSAKLDMLSQKWQLQREAVVQCENALQAAQEQLNAAREAGDPEKVRQATEAVDNARVSLTNAQIALSQTEQEIHATNDALSLAETNWYAAGQAIDASKDAIAGIGRQIQIAENNFRASTAGIQNMEKSVTGLTQKVEMLQGKLSLQEQAVQHWEDALAAARVQLEAAQDANDPDKVREATAAVEDAEVSLSRARAEVAQTRAEIDQTNKQLQVASSAWTAFGAACETAGKRLKDEGKVAEEIGRTLTTAVSAPIAALGVTAIKTSVDFESSFASVRKTVDATEEEFEKLAAASKEMSTQVVASTSEINEVMATGGQLGIANEYLTEFTRTMIDLGNSCEDLDAAAAATSIAKFANVMGTNQGLFQNIGSTIVDLGNNFATTEKPIMEMAQRLAGAGKMVGLTEPEVLGFAAALSSVGIEAQMGGSSLSKALINMEVACATGGEALEDFGLVCGMTGEQFKLLFEADPAAAFQAFIISLAQMDEEGISAIAVLNDIGIKEIRLRDTLLRSVNANELISNALNRANRAWEENTALQEEANKRYATTESQMANLKNKAMLFAQTLGDDLSPAISDLISGLGNLLDGFMDMDKTQRQQLLRWAAVAAAVGPVILVYGKVTTALGGFVTGLGKFATKVGEAGGGLKGFLSVLSGSPAFWFAAAAATVTATVALVDYASGAKATREALESLEETARKWKDTSADTFYRGSEGLSFFGLSAEDFFISEKVNEARTNLAKQSKSLEKEASDWLGGLMAVWTDGKKESDAIVHEWSSSFAELTGATRDGLQEMKTAADRAGNVSLSEQLQADIDTLNDMDREVAMLLARRKNGYITQAETQRLRQLLSTREAIVLKYKLEPDTGTDGNVDEYGVDVSGYNLIQEKLDAANARAQAMGKQNAGIEAYENAVVAAAQGHAAIVDALNEQYDAEYAKILLMEDEDQQLKALDELNERYRKSQEDAARAYSEALKGFLSPVYEQDNIQKAKTDMAEMAQWINKLNEGKISKDTFAGEMAKLVESMDEASLVEFYGLLTQIQSLLDSGMTEDEIKEATGIDFSEPLADLAAIQEYLLANKEEYPQLKALIDALSDEMVTLATDLDLTGAKERWKEFATDPGALIVTNVAMNQKTIPVLNMQAVITEALNPSGDQEIDVSKVTPPTIGAFINMFSPDPNGFTWYDPANPALPSPTLTAIIAKLGLDENTTIEDLVNAAEANGIDLVPALRAYVEGLDPVEGETADTLMQKLLNSPITILVSGYDDTGATKPKATLVGRITTYGHDYIELKKFRDENGIEVDGLVRLSPAFVDENGNKIVNEDGTINPDWADKTKIIVNGQETVTITPDIQADLTGGNFFMDYDKENDCVYVFVRPKITGSQEEVEELHEAVNESDPLENLLPAGEPGHGIAPGATLMGKVRAYIRMFEQEAEREATGGLANGIASFFISIGEKLFGDTSVQFDYDFDKDTSSEFQAYAASIAKAMQLWSNNDENKWEIPESQIEDMRSIIKFLEELQANGEGGNIILGLADQLSRAGIESDASTVIETLKQLLADYEASKVEEQGFDEDSLDKSAEKITGWIPRLQSELGQLQVIEQQFGAEKKAEYLKSLEELLNLDFEGDTEAAKGLGAYIASIAAALQNGEEVGEEDLKKFRDIQAFLQLLSELGLGEGIIEDVTEGMGEEGAENLSAYVSGLVEALQNGETLSPDDYENLQAILSLLRSLDTTGIGDNVMAGIAQGMTEAGLDTTAETVAGNIETALNTALQIHSPSERMKPIGENISAGVGSGMGAHDFSTEATALGASIEAAVGAALPAAMLDPVGTAVMAGLKASLSSYSFADTGASVAGNVRAALSESVNGSSLHAVGVSAMAGLAAGIRAGQAGVIAAMRSAARLAVDAAKIELKIQSPSQVFRDEVGRMSMRGFGEGILRETQEQARTIRNATRYLTGEAREGSIVTTQNDNRRTYNENSNVSLNVANMSVKSEQDIHALAVEIASLTKRQHRGRGLRLA